MVRVERFGSIEAVTTHVPLMYEELCAPRTGSHRLLKRDHGIKFVEVNRVLKLRKIWRKRLVAGDICRRIELLLSQREQAAVGTDIDDYGRGLIECQVV